MSINPSDGFEQAVSHVIEHNLPTPDEDVEFLVFTDASLYEKDGVVGAGWVICRRDGELVCYGSRGYSRSCTIQEAEALAIRCAVEQLRSMDWFDVGVTVYSDNKSLVESFERETKVWDIDVFQELRELLSSSMVKWLQRDYNRVADSLSSEARKKVEAV